MVYVRRSECNSHALIISFHHVVPAIKVNTSILSVSTFIPWIFQMAQAIPLLRILNNFCFAFTDLTAILDVFHVYYSFSKNVFKGAVHNPVF